MNIQQFAEQILRSCSLGDKLFFPECSLDAFTDVHTAIGKLPNVPGRPAKLELYRGEDRRVAFPNALGMKQLSARGIVLHFFANHELLAMELMALALLKFPDAPEKFRLGIIQTIKEEQNHMRLYQKRMEDYGVEFGAVPVSRYFWDCISDMKTPLDYVTRMSLTFEQANLDFSLHFKKLFEELADDETAQVLDQVYREEIGHVKYGVTWFNRWRGGNSSDWQAYNDLLPFPMTPSRAKGIGFDRDGRIATGLSRQYIDELYVFQCSKGRPPVVYFFNPAAEMEAFFPEHSFTAPEAINNITADLSSLLMFLANADDIVLTPQRPQTAFLAAYRDIGFALPQFADWSDLADRTITRFEPWGRTKISLNKVGTFTGRTIESELQETPVHLFSKAWCAGLAAGEEGSTEVFPSEILTSEDSVYAAVEAHLGKSNLPYVLKAPFGSSGRNMLRIMQAGIEPNQLAWIKTTLKTQSQLIGEPWVTKISDLSVQIQVTNDGVKILGTTRFLTDKRGQYIGHYLGKKFFNLSGEFHKAYHQQQFQAALEASALKTGNALFSEGYRGPAGIDAFVFVDESGIQLRPRVEINPRFTMGRIALEIESLVAHKSKAVWIHLSVNGAKKLGWESLRQAATTLQNKFPQVMSEKAGADARKTMAAGALCTNDPDNARAILTLLMVGSACDFALETIIPQLI